MTPIVDHLSVEELERGYRSAADPISKSHFHAIWLLAQGYVASEVARLLSFTTRWVELLRARYNAHGPSALGDQRANNGRAPIVLTAAALAALGDRLKMPPDDGGVWNSVKVARWLAAHHGLAMVHAQRGWDALQRLGYSIQQPRPRHARTADESEQAAFKKNSRRRSPRKRPSTPTSRSRSGRATSTASG